MMVEKGDNINHVATVENSRKCCVSEPLRAHPSRGLLQAADGTEQPLTQREAEILRRLFAHPNEIVERHVACCSICGQRYAIQCSLSSRFCVAIVKLLADAQLSLRNVHGQGNALVVEEN